MERREEVREFDAFIDGDDDGGREFLGDIGFVEAVKGERGMKIIMNYADVQTIAQIEQFLNSSSA